MNTTTDTSKPLPLPGTLQSILRRGVRVWTVRDCTEWTDTTAARVTGGIIIATTEDTLTCVADGSTDVRDRALLGIAVTSVDRGAVHSCGNVNCPAIPSIDAVSSDAHKYARRVCKAIARRLASKSARPQDVAPWVDLACTLYGVATI